ncbi:MAG TPA: uracil-DNA glycosylase, partial [Acetobacteraceae bacterium]|nr:uracil-DNA glycosylase [Acetobacteraceae bacterium]
MDALAALALQLEWGADEALADTPVVRFAAEAPPASLPAPASRPVPVPAPAPVSRIAPPVVSRAEQAAAAADSLAALRAALEGFEGCTLRDTATNLVFQDGNPDAGLMIVGEGPGAEEDRAGLPFVGPSGRLLDRMLGSIGLDRTRCVITNVIFWRPPGNRTPTDTEVLTCLPFLLRHVSLVRPQRIVLLGAMATKAITGNTDGIRKLRGRWLELPVP